MSQKDEDLLTVLDAGSSKIRVLVAELHEGALRYRAHSVVDAEGMRKGLISDLVPASRAFNRAATEAEQMANAVIGNCVVVRLLIAPAPSPCPPIGRSFTYYHNNLFSMSSLASMTPSGW
jgi:hypothetical protein